MTGEAASVVQARDIHGNVHFHSSPPADDQVVIGRIPHEPPNFQPPEQIVTLAGMTSEVCLVCAVTGQRGVGKTQLAAAYARKRVRDGWLVAWINAESPDRIKAGMTNLAERLHVHNPEDDAETAAARLHDHLQSRTTPALLTFDNLTDLSAITPYLPGAGPTQVVITSTIRGAERIGRAVPVDVFDKPTALRFLRAATCLDDAAGAHTLAAELGYLPLALAQAAARIRAGWTYQTYLDRHRTYPVDQYLKSRPGDPYPLGAPAAILIALEPFAPSPLLNTLAVLSPDGVTRDILPPDEAIDDELERLYEASIIEFAGPTRAILMHRLVQRIIRDRCRHERTYLDVLLRQADRLAALAFPEEDSWMQRLRGDELVRQIDALWENSVRDAACAGILSLRSWSVRYLNATAQFLRSVPLALTVASDTKIYFDAESPATLDALTDLARSYRSAGKWAEAIAVCEQALRDERQSLGDGHPHSFIMAAELGNAYVLVGRLEKAILLLDQVLDHDRRNLGDQHLHTLASANNLAGAYKAARRLDEAIPLLERVLAAHQRVLGDDHRDTLISANNLATTVGSAGQLERAIELLERVAADCRRALGDDHPDTLKTVNNLAHAYRSARRYDESILLLKQNLIDCRRVFGIDNPDVLASVRNLACAYLLAGQIGEAIPLFEENLAARKRVVGEDNPGYIGTAIELFSAYQEAGLTDHANELFVRIAPKAVKILPESHPFIDLLKDALREDLG